MIRGQIYNPAIYPGVVAIPEPATGMMLALGLIGLLGVRRRLSAAQ